MAWLAFPRDTGPQHVARIALALVCAAALVWLNRRFLVRDGIRVSALGLGIRRFPFLLAGALLMTVVLGVVAGVLSLTAPFHWKPGSLSWSGLGWCAAEYFAGNAGEELMFRAYLLLAMQRAFGTAPALVIVSLLFGLFHLPGLSGVVAVKMICTTGVWSLVFALGFLKTGSLWTAIGLHAFGNTLLHRVMGMSGDESLFRADFRAPLPNGYGDPGFLTFAGVTLFTAVCLFLWRGRTAQEARIAAGA